jgi:hypothetical protein
MFGFGEDEKTRLRKKYLRARSRLDRLLEPYDCGLALARHISAKVDEAAREFDTVCDEIRAAMKRDGFVPSR